MTAARPGFARPSRFAPPLAIPLIALLAVSGVESARAACDGQFFCETQYPAGTYPHALVVRDFNADHILDVAIANAGDAVTIHLGQGAGGAGDGTFAPAVSYPVPGRPFGIAAGDFNGDGIFDLVTANYSADQVSILLGQGGPGLADGTFAPAGNYPAGPGPFAVTTGDFNGDGITDLAVSNNPCEVGGVSVLLGQGVPGVGDGSFGPPTAYALGCNPAAVRSRDFNSDGILDLVVAVHGPGDFAVLLGLGANRVGNGSFASPTFYPTLANPYDLKVADLNSDGVLDLAIAGATGAGLAVGQGVPDPGDGTFGFQTFPLESSETALEFGDFDRDGVTDIVVVGAATNVLQLLRGLTSDGTADGQFALALQRSVGAGPISVEAGDFNADGRPDLAVANYFGHTLSILLDTYPASSPPDLAGWVENGVKLCTAPGDQTDPRAVSDFSGGAIVVWQDRREAASAVFAQRVSQTGSVLWPVNGVPLCADTTNHTRARIAADGHGGAWVGWLEPDAESASVVRLSHVTAAGAEDPDLPCPGRLVSGPGLVATDLAMVADGEGGVFVAYAGGRTGASAALYCQRLGAGGLPAAGWPEQEGIRVSEWIGEPEGVGSASFSAFDLSPDGAGGTALAWRTQYSCGAPGDPCSMVYSGAARITAEASLPFSDAFRFRAEEDPCGVSMGAGSQLIVTRPAGSDILARRIGPTGDIEWTIPLCTAAGERDLAAVAPDAGGGAAAIWIDRRFGDWDLFAGRVAPDGTLANGWPANGLAISLAAGDQVQPQVIPGPDQGLTLCWVDRRSGGDDLYAVQIDSDGGRRTGWPQGGGPVCAAEGDQKAPSMIESQGGAIVAWQDGRNDNGDIYAQRISSPAPVDVGPDPTLPKHTSLSGASPNPARALVWAEFSLANGHPAALELFDLAGRRLLSREVGGMGEGLHRIALNPAAPLAPGLYLLRLRAGDRSLSRPVIVTK